MKNRLRVEGLRKRVGHGATEFTLEASFEVAAGARAVLTGASGGGKTTLLRLLAGLEHADAGRVWVGDQDLSRLPARAREVGYVFQDHALFPSMTVLENAAFALRMRGVAPAERDRRALEWLERMGLAAKRDQAVTTLSGGERSRVAFVRALIAEPRLLLLDEPFAALDSGLRAGLRAELLALHARHPAPMIIVSHDVEDAAALATVRLTLATSADGRVRKIEL